MLKNYFKIAFRNIWSQKGYSFINIFGLAIGLACCILILLFVQYELSYDKYNKNSDRIYRLTREWFNQDGASSLHLARIAPPFGPWLKNDYPNIVLEEARFLQDYQTFLKINNNTLVEERFYWAEPSAFKIFSISFINGNPETALNEPNSLVITESMAKKYFGTDDVIGKTINYERQRDLKITGVVKDVPENSHFKYDFLASFVTLNDSTIIGRRELETNLGSNNYLTYLLLPKGLPVKALEDKIPGFIDKYVGLNLKARGIALPTKPLHDLTILHLQKLIDIHLHSHLTTEIEQNGDIENIYLLSAIAFFILLIACINFMNLATARSSKRSKEIGVRKVLGAVKGQLRNQFLGESMITAFISLFFSILIVELTIKSFGIFADRNLSFNFINQPMILLWVILITLVVGFIAGIYPAFMLSSFKPVSAIKNEGVKERKSKFRTVLVVLQFTISIVLLIGMGVVFEQMQFVKNKDLGYNKDNLIVLPSSNQIRQNLDTFKSQLLQNSNIKMVASSRLVPSDMLLNSMGGQIYDGNKMVPLSFRLALQEVSYDFLNTYQIKITAGRGFSRDFPTDDSTAFILNETAVHQFGWNAQDAIDKPIFYGPRKGKIIGVVQDFNFETLHNEIVPIIMMINKNASSQITVRISGNDIPATLNYLKKKWAEYRPDYPFDFTFLNEQLNSLYNKDEKLGDVFGIFSFIAVIIACLGLFGLASFTAEVRTKEIGIRKVLGASVSNIVLHLSKEFLILIIFSIVIACPLSFYAMNKWLDGFAYKTTISPWLFVFAGSLALLIAILTVSLQAIKAAIANPVKSLRYE